MHRSVAARTVGLVSQAGKKEPVVMTGGVARSRAAVYFLGQALRVPIEVPDHPQISGAYGAALLALESLQGETTVIGQAVDRDHVHTGTSTGRDCTSCTHGRNRFQPIDIELWTDAVAPDRRAP
ncbi:BadF/BadG/BcrA/BcrD ATPase family protein [Nostocoides sp.]